MGGKSDDPQVEVNDYHLSMHVGVAHSVDAVTGIYYGEKKFWSGYAMTNTTVAINNRGLNGGNKKEGGVAGAIHVLLGGISQVLPDALANRLGRSSGADCPGFRGVTSLFFTGTASGGFFWTSNTPYLKPLWTTVLRAPKGLNSAKALIGTDITYATSKLPALLLVRGETISDQSEYDRAITIGSKDTGYGAATTGPTIASKSIVDAFDGTAIYTDTERTSWIDVDTSDWFPKGQSWTIELRIKLSQWWTPGSFSGLVTNQFLQILTGDALSLNYYGCIRPYFTHGGLHFDVLGSSISPDYEWHHFALCRRANGSMYSCVDGNVSFIGTGDPDVRKLLFGGFYHNVDGGGPSTASVYMDELRISPTDLYSASPTYTVPTARHPTKVDGPIYISDVKADANPAHMIYECLTNTDWGMGESSDLIDVASFEACGNTLFDENFGLSMIWTRQSTVEDFTNEVMNHINGVVFTNPRTGLHTMRLVRGGYDEGTLREINPDNANLLKFSRRVWGETTNEIVVTWTNPETEKEETVSLQDLGNISMQGAVISASRNFYGVRSGDLAMQLAARELRVAASPLCTCDIELDRSAWDILPADVIALTWPEFGVVGLPMRVGSVDYGRIGDSKIKITLVEDVFALPTSHYESPPSTEFLGGRESPVPVVTSKVFTLPAYMSAGIVTGGLPSLVYPNAYAGVLAQAPSNDSQSFELLGTVASSTGSMVWSGKGTMPFTGHGTLSAPIVAEVTSTVPAFAGGSEPEVAGFGIIGDGSEEGSEIVLFTSYSEASGWSIKRGVLDTVPADWSTGTTIWFLSKTSSAYDATVLSAGLSPQYKLLTNTSLGQLSEDDAPIVSSTLTERPHLPLRPANLKVDTVGFGTRDGSGLAAVSVSWATRNRLTEETVVLGWADGSTPGEIGQTVTLEIDDDAGVRVKTISGLTTSPYTLDLNAFGKVGDVNVNAYAVKGALKSLQAHTVRVSNIGLFRVNDSGDIRTTDTGSKRIVNITGAPNIISEGVSSDVGLGTNLVQAAAAIQPGEPTKIAVTFGYSATPIVAIAGEQFQVRMEKGPYGYGSRVVTYTYIATGGETREGIMAGLVAAIPVTSDGLPAGFTFSFSLGFGYQPVAVFPWGQPTWTLTATTTHSDAFSSISIITLGSEAIASDRAQIVDIGLQNYSDYAALPTVGHKYRITLNSTVYERVVQEGDTFASIRSVLAGLIDADPAYISVTPAPSGYGTYDIRITSAVVNTPFSYSGTWIRAI